MRVFVFYLGLVLLSLPVIAAGPPIDPNHPCTLKNKTFCGDWFDFTMYGDYIEWDKKYGDIAHCKILDEQKLTNRTYSILQCTVQRHLQNINCKAELSFRVKGSEPEKCIDSINGMHNAYTIEKPEFWMFSVIPLVPKDKYGDRFAYTITVHESLACVLSPLENNGMLNSVIEKEYGCFRYTMQEYGSQKTERNKPVFSP